jgi:hypothetical protein
MYEEIDEKAPETRSEGISGFLSAGLGSRVSRILAGAMIHRPFFDVVPGLPR